MVYMITRKKKICKNCNKLNYIFGHGLCQYCYNKTNKTSIMNKTRFKRSIKASLKAKINKADTLYSQIIKLRNHLHDYSNYCYTCNIRDMYNNLECGHYMSRKHYNTRWLLQNGRPQCFICNNDKRGNLEVYREKLELEIPGLPDALEKLAKIPMKLSSTLLDEIIDNLQIELKKLN